MYTLRLEITTVNRADFYNPAVEECHAFPRTKEGINRAFKKFRKWVLNNSSMITGAQILLYEGKHEYYKDMEPICIEKIY